MNLSIDDLEKDLKIILESNSEEVVDGETSVAHNVNAVYDYMQSVILPATESMSGKDFRLAADNDDTGSSAAEVLETFEAFNSNKLLLTKIRERALIEESECCNNIAQVERMIKEYFAVNTDSQQIAPIDTASLVNAAALETYKIRRDKLYDKLRSVSGNFDHRLCAEEESAGAGQRGEWSELEKHRKLLSESVDKSGYIKALRGMLKENEDSSSYVVPLNAFKPKSDTLNGLDGNVMHQMAKDIERDVLLINNTRLAHGSKHGYKGICDMLREEIERAQRFLYFSTTSGKMTLPPFEKVDDESVDNFIGNVLFACNRTQSGGDTFDLLNQIFFHEELAILVPDNTNTPPLEVSIDCGPYKEHTNFRSEFNTYSWAVRAVVKAKMLFSICDVSPVDEGSAAAWGKVSGSFERLLVMPVKNTIGKTHYYDRGLTDRGVVTIELSDVREARGSTQNAPAPGVNATPIDSMGECENVASDIRPMENQDTNVLNEKDKQKLPDADAKGAVIGQLDNGHNETIEMEHEHVDDLIHMENPGQSREKASPLYTPGAVGDSEQYQESDKHDGDEIFLGNIDSFIKEDSVVVENDPTENEGDENVDNLLDALRDDHLADGEGWEDDAWGDAEVFDEMPLDISSKEVTVVEADMGPQSVAVGAEEEEDDNEGWEDEDIFDDLA
eukprot:g13174.t1